MKDHECHTCIECVHLEMIRKRVVFDDDLGRTFAYREAAMPFCTRQQGTWEGVTKREPTDEACEHIELKGDKP
jgi:hypothetical protein